MQRFDGSASRQPARVVAADMIRSAILDGRLAPGETLKEEELAGELNISRTPVREALLMLSAEGIIEATTNRSAVVKVYDKDDVEDMSNLRAELESYAAATAAERATEADFAALRDSCERYSARDAEDVAALVSENLHFHTLIAHASGSERLPVMLRLVMFFPQYRSHIWFTPERKQTVANDHWRILASLQARDGERAKALMRAHVNEGKTFVLDHIVDPPADDGARPPLADDAAAVVADGAELDAAAVDGGQGARATTG